MPPLTIVSSDQPDTLVERLALDLAAAPLGPFDEETIVVQSRGTERWVRQELARRHGCAAGLWFPFAASFFRELTESLVGPAAGASGAIAHATTSREDDAFGRDALTWRIYDLLDGRLCDEPGFETLRAFVTEEFGRDMRKMLGLARTLAGRYAEYQLYRPDVLARWEREESSVDWQATLWRCICASNAAECHAGAQYRQAIEALKSAAPSQRDLPSRLSIFGVNTLPPIYVELLHAVAKHTPVRLYLQAPPRETWNDVPRNPLFATFGGVVRDFVELLETTAPTDEPVQWEEHHSPSPTASRPGLLARLQADVRAGVERGPASDCAPRLTLDASDTDESLSVHLCHSPMREMEVLRDQLLAALAADPTLRPHDILLLVPEVAAYAPLVDAVFGVGEPELPRIPYRIADRAVAQESRLADAALRILRLVGARWTSAEIVELLDLPPVRHAAGLPADGAARVLAWIEETRIRWGRDGAMRREQFDLPPVEANSWRAGMDRLLMGYATGRTTDFVADVLPYAGDTIGDPVTLGAFSHFLERLFDTLADWRTARTLAEWSEQLRTAFTTLLQAEDDDEECELEALLALVSELATIDLGGDASRTVELPVVRDWLEERLGGALTSAGFLAGGMTVAALRAMRVVPHRIVAIAGLDDASFPRSQPRAAFDLLATEKRLGDRDRRADDRQAFLDTLLAAGDRLLLSYVARSAQTNAERAASVVVAELLDLVDRTFDAGAVRARTLVTVAHRLQPFSPAYFTGGTSSRLFSYSRANARALAALSASGRNGGTPFVSGPLAVASDDELRDIRLDDLIDCWSNPSRFFCTRTLGLHLRGDAAPVTECEPMTVNGLDRYKVHDAMLRRHLNGGRTPERERAEAVALGMLPSGALCGVWFDRLDEELGGLLATLGEVSLEDPVNAEVTGSSWTLSGRVEGITGRGRLQVRPATCKPTDLIRAWITHLVLTAAFGEPTTTDVVAMDGHTTFGEVADPMSPLEELVRGYRAALRAPLPFFAQASYAYVVRAVEMVRKPNLQRSPLDMARTALDGSEYGDYATGDLQEPYVALCWRGLDPLEDAGAEFERLATSFWRPAMAAMGGAAEVAG
ncbi:MAG TPA: exodeoxyribonuclease V subunit gamma [Gemmatimonadaceae bacterium]|nr:exodeoxyribonuclease V subunit gamma [Gemmatimonadaceae bacterium]